MSTSAEALTVHLQRACAPEIDAIRTHPWVRSFADGSLPEQAFINWAGQCGLFCLLERPALLVLRSYIQPGKLDDLLAHLVEDTVREPRELAAHLEKLGAPAPSQPWPACSGYGSYVQARAHDGLLPGLVAVYAAENNYLTAWTDLLPSCPPESPYRSWAENWSCDAFRDVVDGLRSCLDQEAGPLSEPMLDSLTATYKTASLWELAFWEMSWTGAGWPAVRVQS